ncbi:hypothetical protein WJU16_15140 [Chitinophaga pollutisoli]|uniref:Uncharacterized protein n=1 Tax=Chitinophaga pollutisoli TaxID=3133966 RepID=A0ABZ2YHX7_9BACT
MKFPTAENPFSGTEKLEKMQNKLGNAACVKTAAFKGLKRKRALRKAPSICYYPMKTLFVYKGISMLTLFEIFEGE